MQIKELAELMGVTERDASDFVEGLRIWTAKGYSLQEAIARHMDLMGRVLKASTRIDHENASVIAVDAFFPPAIPT